MFWFDNFILLLLDLLLDAWEISVMFYLSVPKCELLDN